MTRIKICGITNPDDALVAAEAGADAIGLVFADSPRKVTPDVAASVVRALPPFVSAIGVFVNASADEIARITSRVALEMLQLHGEESPQECARLSHRLIKRFNVRESDTPQSLREQMQRYRVAAHLLDPGAGSGRTFDWTLARDLPGRLIISGGLTPENVAAVVRLVRPYAVDVCSGVERKPGRKDPAKTRAFVQAVRNADAQLCDQ